MPDDADLNALADALAQRLNVSAFTPWMTVPQAAHYLACPESRLRKLVMLKQIPHHRDGRRILFHRDELDRYIRNGGAHAC